MQRRLLPVIVAAIAAAVGPLALDPHGGGGDGDGGARGGSGGSRTPGRVARVIDGDTIAVATSGEGYARERSVRLLGIDTPETHKPGTPIECGGPEASANMARI